jgi:hypothetical protein
VKQLPGSCAGHFFLAGACYCSGDVTFGMLGGGGRRDLKANSGAGQRQALNPRRQRELVCFLSYSRYDSGQEGIASCSAQLPRLILGGGHACCSEARALPFVIIKPWIAGLSPLLPPAFSQFMGEEPAPPKKASAQVAAAALSAGASNSRKGFRSESGVHRRLASLAREPSCLLVLAPAA